MTKLPAFDKSLEIFTLLILLGVWVYLLFVYPSLPSIIPSHFNLSGEADDFSSKTSIWILPVVATAVYAALTLLSRIPHKFNYPVAVTTGNAERLYAATVRLLKVIRFLVVLIFSLLVYQVCAGIKDGSFRLGTWFGPAVVGVLMLTVGFYLISVTKNA